MRSTEILMSRMIGLPPKTSGRVVMRLERVFFRSHQFILSNVGLQNRGGIAGERFPVPKLYLLPFCAGAARRWSPTGVVSLQSLLKNSTGRLPRSWERSRSCQNADEDIVRKNSPFGQD